MNFWKEQLSRIAALLVLAVFFSVMTRREEYPQDAAAARELVSGIAKDTKVMVAVRGVAEDKAFAEALKAELGPRAVEVVTGEPRDARKALDRVSATGLDVIIGTQVTAEWLVFSDLKDVTLLKPSSRTWPVFLTRDNLLNIASQIAVIAILAIGMTLVIIAGGIDLSVGSLLALSAVVTTLIIRDAFGGEKASSMQMMVAALGGIGLCAASGWLAGGIITRLRMPPFIVTLAMMLVGSGLAYRLADNQSVYQVPESFIWLGRGADLMNVPNAVVLMLLLYAVAHVMMTQTAFGRHLYAVGGNAEAALVSGVPVKRVTVMAYALCGLLAGLGGVVMASQLKSGSGTFGAKYELYAIAAAVVGGTSLSGGRGTMPGTLIGAFIIAVIQNGMNLTNVESNTQNIVLGLVILAAVAMERKK
ncbi:MAG: Ribose transport system permease protein RbsC [Verrucomicrobiota bacterium]|jgi:ribose transport system permease protein